MSDSADTINFKQCVAVVVLNHCQHMAARRKIQGALYYLQRQGVVERIGKDKWRAVKK